MADTTAEETLLSAVLRPAKNLQVGWWQGNEQEKSHCSPVNPYNIHLLLAFVIPLIDHPGQMLNEYMSQSLLISDVHEHNDHILHQKNVWQTQVVKQNSW